jgi:WD40 repeat protein
MLTMQSSADYVSDIQWSPNVSTIFASVTGDGYVNIWDMSISTLDPIISEKILPHKPTCIRFSPNTDVVVAGDNTGRVTVYRVSGIDDTKYTHEEQVARFDKALAAKDADTTEAAQ